MSYYGNGSAGSGAGGYGRNSSGGGGVGGGVGGGSYYGGGMNNTSAPSNGPSNASSSSSSMFGQPQQQQQQYQQQQQQPQQQQQYGYGANVQQWQQPQAQPQQQQQLPPQQQQQQGQQPNFFSNDLAAAAIAAAAGGKLSNDALMNAIGQRFLENSSARMVPGLEYTMNLLRLYFAVDNHYVKRKILKVLFPFLSKQWERMPNQAALSPNDTHRFALPTVDENAPDLYLPSMTLITYVLLAALCYGTAGKFNPEVLPDVTTKCFVTQLLEVLAIRCGFYMMQAPVDVLDLFAYTGYKYLGLCVNMVAGIFLSQFGFGAKAYYVFFLWTASAASFFMLKTMMSNIPAQVAASGPKRELMVVIFAASQFVTMWFVSQTKFLDFKEDVSA